MCRCRTCAQYTNICPNARPNLISNNFQEYEIDFVSLSYVRTMDDVVEARDFLDSVGLTATKIFAKLESRQVGWLM